MKPREDGEGVAMAKTPEDLTYPNMTQDEPERVKAEDMQPVCVWCDHVLACDHCGTEQPYDDMSVLKAKLSVSEKRAEGLEGNLAALQMAYDGIKRNRDLALRQSGELRAKAESERDSSQASLLRVVGEVDADLLGVCAEALFDAGQKNLCRQLLKQADLIRTALSPHTEK